MPRKQPTPPAERKLSPAELFARQLNLKTAHERSEAARERRYQAERDLLVAVLSRIWPSHITTAGRRSIIWSEVVCIHSPAGQLAWGLPPDRQHWFSHLERSACEWDRHGASERAARLRALLKMPTITAEKPKRPRAKATKPTEPAEVI